MTASGGPVGSPGWHEMAALRLSLRGLLWVGPGGSIKTHSGAPGIGREVSRELGAAVRRLKDVHAVDASMVYAQVRITEYGRRALLALLTDSAAGATAATIADQIRRQGIAGVRHG